MSATLENLRRELIEKIKIYPNPDKILEALEYGQNLHDGQLRKSGEPYFIHPIEVALEIIRLQLDEDAVIAALLHDTLEDCNIQYTDIAERFGNNVADIVEGVTKVSNITDNSLKRYSELESLRKFVIASSKDIRVLLIKLADRLHNMKTISALKPEKQIIYSDETLKVYVPLAEYIWIGKLKRELEDIAFRIKEPEKFQIIENLISKDANLSSEITKNFINTIEKLLIENEFSDFKVFGRTKSYYSLYNKILRKIKEGEELEKFDISRIKDYIAVSIVMGSNKTRDCYHVLGIVHEYFQYSERDFSDYIAKPKPNNYKSIHTVVKFEGRFCEIQIKTAQMHDANEFGPASHIAYKLSGQKNAKPTNQFQWVKSLTKWTEDPAQNYKLDIFDNKVFAITPKGKIIELPKGSTTLDFAYEIHSEVGNKYIGAKINGHIVKINTQIQNGDIVEILTSKNHKQPPLEWINYAFLSRTKSKIKRFAIQFDIEKEITNGKNELSKYFLQKIKIDWLNLDSTVINHVLNELNLKEIDELYTKISNKTINKRTVLKVAVKKLNLEIEKDKPILTKKEDDKNDYIKKVVFEGVRGLDYAKAKCCNPIYNDKIVGIVTLRDGLKIHKADCKQIIDFDEERILDAKWE